MPLITVRLFHWVTESAIMKPVFIWTTCDFITRMPVAISTLNEFWCLSLKIHYFFVTNMKHLTSLSSHCIMCLFIFSQGLCKAYIEPNVTLSMLRPDLLSHSVLRIPEGKKIPTCLFIFFIYQSYFVVFLNELTLIFWNLLHCTFYSKNNNFVAWLFLVIGKCRPRQSAVCRVLLCCKRSYILPCN